MPAQGGFREEASHNTGRERPTANKNKCRTGEMGPCDYDRGQRVSLYIQSQKMKRSKAAARCWQSIPSCLKSLVWPLTAVGFIKND